MYSYNQKLMVAVSFMLFQLLLAFPKLWCLQFSLHHSGFVNAGKTTIGKHNIT